MDADKQVVFHEPAPVKRRRESSAASYFREPLCLSSNDTRSPVDVGPLRLSLLRNSSKRAGSSSVHVWSYDNRRSYDVKKQKMLDEAQARRRLQKAQVGAELFCDESLSDALSDDEERERSDLMCDDEHIHWHTDLTDYSDDMDTEESKAPSPQSDHPKNTSQDRFVERMQLEIQLLRNQMVASRHREAEQENYISQLKSSLSESVTLVKKLDETQHRLNESLSSQKRAESACVQLQVLHRVSKDTIDALSAELKAAQSTKQRVALRRMA